MKILYRILVILLWIFIILLLIFVIPIVLIISPVIYLFTGRTEGLFFDMRLKTVDYLMDTALMLEKKGE